MQQNLIDDTSFFYSQSDKKMTIKPFVKWVGGKNQIMSILLENLPPKFNHYYEPFVGGGALFFNLQPKEATISDMNFELISSYRCFKTNSKFKKLISNLDVHQTNHNKKYYLDVRKIDRETDLKKLDIDVIAARFIYMNKAGFNGLFRVNSLGYNNVPDGKKTNLTVYAKDNLNGIREYFKTSKIRVINKDFTYTVKNAQANDFVYFDPPYDSFDNEKNFTNYQKNGFNRNDQIRLFNTFKSLSDKGVFVMLSNHNTEFIRDLYNDFKIKIIHAKRMINSNGAKRGPVEEVIITNY